MTVSLVGAAYIVSALLFIVSLAGLARHETARRGNLAGMAGMLIALVATVALALYNSESHAVATGLLILLAMGIGAGIGIWQARKVAMTAMPQLVALLHSFVGLAAVLVGYNSYLVEADAGGSQLAEIYLGVFIGAITFAGSIIAYLKLSEQIPSAPLMLPARHLLNLAAVAACGALMIWFVSAPRPVPLILMTLLALALGAHLVASIGGGDMPVVVSMLNSYSGWAAAAAGFMLGNDLLIVTGALVGSSGAILSYIMCKAMNRSFVSVIAGGFGNRPAVASGAQVVGEHVETTAVEVAELLRGAQTVVISPGYGMAVAQAQNPVAELTARLRANGVSVRFGIHPVAGRLPGHMNVLLAEARVPYDIVVASEDINDELAETDVVLVIGANDTVNPAALDDPGSPIAGMPVMQVWKASHVVVFKRSMATGYAGVQNPLFFKPNTKMLFGDAKERVNDILAALPRADAHSER